MIWALFAIVKMSLRKKSLIILPLNGAAVRLKIFRTILARTQEISVR